jgi:hypothetical protein
MQQQKPVLSDELSRRRRAIYAGLKQCLVDSAAIQGTRLWNNEFSDKPLYALQPFLTRLFEDLNIELSRAELQQKLLSALMLKPHELPDDPLKPSQQTGNIAFGIMPNAHKVFTCFMDNLLAKLFKVSPDTELSIKVFIFDNAHKVGIKGQALNNIKNWLSNSAQVALIEDLDMPQMQGLFHYCYIAACEYLGPVTTDKLVAESVKIAEQLPESNECSPRMFF